MRQRRWLELVKDYDCEIMYHLGKMDKVADALSRKATTSLVAMIEISTSLKIEMESFGLELLAGQLSALTITSTMFDDIKEKQDHDPKLQRIRKGMQDDKYLGFQLDYQGILLFGSRLCEIMRT